jgi:hypothetical protein
MTLADSASYLGTGTTHALIKRELLELKYYRCYIFQC